MDKLELIMKHAAFDQRVFVGGFQPAEQIGYQFRHAPGGRSNMDNFHRPHYTHAAGAVATWRIEQAEGHDFMRLEQVRFAGEDYPALLVVTEDDGSTGDWKTSSSFRHISGRACSGR